MAWRRTPGRSARVVRGRTRAYGEQRPAVLQLKHCFQTNGLPVNKDWARFFARTGARVGLSIDGPADLHDASRRTRDGRGTHERAMRAVRLLQDQGVGFHVITVLTERALDHAERLFDFYVQNEIKEVGFNVEEIEGVNPKSSLAGRNVETKFRQFIKRFFELVWAAPGRFKVRELDSAIAHILSDEPVRDEQNLPFAIVSVGYDGMISTFSPELLGARHPRFDAFAFGQLATHGFRTSSMPRSTRPSAAKSAVAWKHANATAAISDGVAAERR